MNIPLTDLNTLKTCRLSLNHEIVEIGLKNKTKHLQAFFGLNDSETQPTKILIRVYCEYSYISFSKVIMKAELKLEHIRTLESKLADECPFGNAQHINNLIDRLCLHRLSLAETKLPAAFKLKEALCTLSDDRRRYFLRDSALRLGVDQALLYAKGLSARYTLDWTVQLLSQATSLLRCPDQTALLESLQPMSARLGPGLSSPFVWHSPNTNAILQGIEEIVYETVPDACIDAPRPEQIQTLQAGVTLLEYLLPRLTLSALNHAIAIIIVSHQETPGLGHRGFGSGTTRSLPGVIVVSASELTTPWQAAEILLHEALHLKFIDLEFTHSMNLKSNNGIEPWTIIPPWRKLNAGSEGWSPIRAMTAAHVYTGLSLFFQSSQLLEHSDTLASYGPVEFQRMIQAAPYRAQFLLGELSERIESLGLAGQYFVKWLQYLTEQLTKVTSPSLLQYCSHKNFSS
jgi:hypothetical protein